MKKKIATLLLTMALTAGMLAGCGDSANSGAGNSDGSAGAAGSGKTTAQSDTGKADEVKEPQIVWNPMDVKVYYSQKIDDEVTEELEVGHIAYTRDDAGNVLNQVTTVNPEWANVTYYTAGTNEYQYDDQKRLVSYQATDKDGKKTASYTIAYSADGLTATRDDFGEDGKQTRQIVTEYYDAERTKQKNQKSYKMEENGQLRLDSERAYDEHGAMVLDVNYYSDGGKSERVYEYTYDEHGACTQEEYRFRELEKLFSGTGNDGSRICRSWIVQGFLQK